VETKQVKELQIGDKIIGPTTGNHLEITEIKQSVVFGWNAYNTEYGQLYLDPEATILAECNQTTTG
tara:strand:- start:19 stop:216 length:198 start_codon:yes stop_codon:yes gene_type:complete